MRSKRPLHVASNVYEAYEDKFWEDPLWHDYGKPEETLERQTLMYMLFCLRA